MGSDRALEFQAARKAEKDQLLAANVTADDEFRRSTVALNRSRGQSFDRQHTHETGFGANQQ